MKKILLTDKNMLFLVLLYLLDYPNWSFVHWPPIHIYMLGLSHLLLFFYKGIIVVKNGVPVFSFFW